MKKIKAITITRIAVTYRNNDSNNRATQLTQTINSSNTPLRAELTYLVKKFDPARLFRIEQSINHGISLITKWLTTYKFKDWKLTESKQEKVTSEMKTNRATQIAQVLGNAQKWHSHGRGISMKELMGPEIKLKINDFGENEQLNQCVKNYHGFCVDHFSKNLGIGGYVHSSIGVRVVQWPM